MDNRLLFQFRIHFNPHATPSGCKERIEAAMLEWVLARRWDCYIGALGGGHISYGAIWRKTGDVTFEDREEFANWIQRQQVNCEVMLGDPEPTETSDIRRVLTERKLTVFNVADSGQSAHSKNCPKQ